MLTANTLGDCLRRQAPLLALAPMQDVTDLPFWRLMTAYGGPDVYFTEYFRVYPGSHLDRNILRSIIENPTERPVVAQMIGNDVTALVRSARELCRFAIAAVDLNLGCPAPVVYRKCAGGGLLRDLQTVDAILGALRDAVALPLTVKTRLGFEDADSFDRLLQILARRGVDLVTVHGRTVHDMYRSAVRYDLIARAVERLPCPVLANGNVYSAHKAQSVLEETGARGVMIGRGAIRNPWIFDQIRRLRRGEPVRLPTGREVLGYVRALYDLTRPPGMREAAQVQKMKKYLNYLGLGVEASGRFLHEIRRVTSERQLFASCAAFLDHDDPMPLEPFDLPLEPRDIMAGAQR
jgi:nifR3 family TIM-barrel protein